MRDSGFALRGALRRAAALIVFCFLLSRHGDCQPSNKRPVTVWLIPSEEAEVRAASDSADIAKEIRDFNQNLERDGRVRVLNTLPPLDQQLIVWNPAFAVPNWAWVKNQTQTIIALQRFAASHDVDVNVRFITWDRAFADITHPRKPNDPGPAPDVVQIGTTWAAYLVSKGMIISGAPTRDKPWIPVLGTPAICLPYITDARLLFYWKRLPTDSAATKVMSLDASSWEGILASLKRQGGPEDRLAFAGGLTLNLMFDYSMLEWAGGADPVVTNRWRTHADFTSEKALKVPLELANAVAGKDGRRLVVVPESSHQELTKEFVVGHYRGTIEPANFISRWKKDFDKTFNGSKHFWDYAAAAVPPFPFKGGSYLAVMRSERPASESFQLAEFLATDPDFTAVLARNAQLPSLRQRNGIDVLLDSLGGADLPEAQQFTSLVQKSYLTGKNLPDLADFPTTIESADVQEAVQRIWRRMGDGDAEGLREEAKSAETILNVKLDWVMKARNNLVGSLWFAVPLLISFLIVMISQIRSNLARVSAALVEKNVAFEREAAALEQVKRLLDQIRKLRGFSAMALLALARYHRSLRKYDSVSSGDEDRKKRGIIAAGINGWRRARNPQNWEPAPAREVVWRSILLGVDVTVLADVYEGWEQASADDPKRFLEEQQILRASSTATDSKTTYYFDVSGGEDFLIPAPFLFEQALASLIQNSIKACDLQCEEKPGPRAPISILISREKVTIFNSGPPISEDIRTLINQSPTSEEFEEAVLRAVRTNQGGVIGIGLTEAYTIASHYYNGMQIADLEASVSIMLITEEGTE